MIYLLIHCSFQSYTIMHCKFYKNTRYLKLKVKRLGDQKFNQIVVSQLLIKERGISREKEKASRDVGGRCTIRDQEDGRPEGKYSFSLIRSRLSLKQMHYKSAGSLFWIGFIKHIITVVFDISTILQLISSSFLFIFNAVRCATQRKSRNRQV